MKIITFFVVEVKKKKRAGPTVHLPPSSVAGGHTLYVHCGKTTRGTVGHCYATCTGAGWTGRTLALGTAERPVA